MNTEREIAELADELASHSMSGLSEPEKLLATNTIEALRSYATLLAKQAEDARDDEPAKLQAEINRAAETLPPGVQVKLVVENGAGYVYWTDSEGTINHLDGADLSLSEQFAAATDEAIATDTGEHE